jgi:uncharacterized membrane protein YjgN (DUF898 family)
MVAPRPEHPLGARSTVRFAFDGGAASHFGVRLLAAIVTLGTLGFGFPLGFVLVRRWKARHLVVDGRRLVFTGSARELFSDWVSWWLLTVATLGIYGLWVYPRVASWAWLHTDFAMSWQWTPADAPSEPTRPLAAPSRLPLAFFASPGMHQLVG